MRSLNVKYCIERETCRIYDTRELKRKRRGSAVAFGEWVKHGGWKCDCLDLDTCQRRWEEAKRANTPLEPHRLSQSHHVRNHFQWKNPAPSNIFASKFQRARGRAWSATMSYIFKNSASTPFNQTNRPKIEGGRAISYFHWECTVSQTRESCTLHDARIGNRARSVVTTHSVYVWDELWTYFTDGE